MIVDRRRFLSFLGTAATAGFLPAGRADVSSSLESLYDIPSFGDIRILHTSDMHAQASPIYFREPSVNLGASSARGRVPHLVGEAVLAKYNIPDSEALAHALTYLRFEELADRYGKVGGLAHIATLCERLREEFGRAKTLHLDSGDLLQGSAITNRNGGRDMIAAANLLGIDAMTGHWEFTYPEAQLRQALADFNGHFIAQNIYVTEEAQFDGASTDDEDTGRAFPAYVVHELSGRRVAVIGQAFPFTPIANPRRFIPDWTFGIRAAELRDTVEKIRAVEKPDFLVFLSHNGTGLDLQLAQQIPYIDVILGGHTHDAFPVPVMVANAAGETAVMNAGCSGKFVGCLDVQFGSGRPELRYHLLPIFSRYLSASADMSALVERYRQPHKEELSEVLCVSADTLYRRGSFNGSMDQVIVDALRQYYEAQIAFSPGFRWGTTLLAGDSIRLEDVMNATAMTYPETYVRDMRGSDIHAILEDIADNMFHVDPFYRQGGDMVRTGGIRYTLQPDAAVGKRITELRLSTGQLLASEQTYKVAGWATAGSISAGPPVWEVVADYLRQQQIYHVGDIELPTLVGIRGDLGVGDYPSNLLE